MSPPSTRIALTLFADPRKFVTGVQENGSDEFVMQLPLRHGSARIEFDGGVLFDGAVWPGLLRVPAPGERVSITRRSAAKGATLTVPGSLFRQIADEQGFTRTRSAMSFVDPVIEPDPRID